MPAPEKLAIHGGAPLRTRPFGPRWYFGEEEKRHLAEVIDDASEPADTPDRQRWRSRFKVTAFCSALAERHGMHYAVPTNSATAAIHTAIAAINPEPGDEVITTPVTDTGGILGIMLQNCIPVFADSDRDTFNIDPDDIDRRITERTRAIIATHLHGNPCDMGAIMEIGRTHGIPVIEDCAQAHLAQYQGDPVGTIGDIGIWSFGGKTLTTGAGGMLMTNNEEFARRASNFVRKGSENDIMFRSSLAPEPEPVYTRGYAAFLGTTYAMTDLEAAVGLAQYERWDDATEVRLRTAEILNEVVPDLPGFRVQQVRPGDVNSYYVYAYKIDPKAAGVSSTEFADAVNAEGVSDCHGPYISGRALHTYPLFTEEDTYGSSRFPFVDEQGNRRIDYSEVRLPVIERELPMTGSILFRNSYTEEDARDIAGAMKKVSDYYAPAD